MRIMIIILTFVLPNLSWGAGRAGDGVTITGGGPITLSSGAGGDLFDIRAPHIEYIEKPGKRKISAIENFWFYSQIASAHRGRDCIAQKEKEAKVLEVQRALEETISMKGLNKHILFDFDSIEIIESINGLHQIFSINAKISVPQKLTDVDFSCTIVDNIPVRHTSALKLNPAKSVNTFLDITRLKSDYKSEVKNLYGQASYIICKQNDGDGRVRGPILFDTVAVDTTQCNS